MKPRDRTPQVLVEVPPLALRVFDDQPLVHDPAETGRGVYGTREAWLAARQEWAGRHGMTVREWWQELAGHAQATARTLDEINAPFLPGYWAEDDEDDDPRLR